MNKAISIIRIAVLLALGILAIALFFGSESADNTAQWLLSFIFDKGLAVLAVYAFLRLYRRWSKTDHWLRRYEEHCQRIGQ